jgi:hypothetical protein
VPWASIQISGLAIRRRGGVVVVVGVGGVGVVVGSWMPTLMGSACVRAADCRPRTNGERDAGRHSDTDSLADEAM